MAVAGSLVVAESPLNLTRAKAAVIAYYRSGAYHAEVQAVADESIAWLQQRTERRQSDERLAMVFDVDETVLSNYGHMGSQDFGYINEVWEHWVDQGAAPPLQAVRDVYRRARALDVAVIFLTGRRGPKAEAGTVVNLRKAEMEAYARSIFRTAAERKAARRAQLEAEGWTIIASIGDQYSDLTGGHTERTFKLPNPFYEVP
ncbi:MAG: hypothetical protein J6386_17385 [Candidatus Synoicihabitans palmerolidicus]|nr:hypothetical protein [Candidatus Synoicihabitans palmerolidicus]